MNQWKQIPLLFFIIFSLNSTLNAQYISTPGKSDQPLPVTLKNSKPFKYTPINPEFFNTIKKILDDKDFSQAVKISTQVIKNAGTDEQDEAYYLLSLTLHKVGLTYGASHILKSIAHRRIGTSIGSAALHQLSLIAQNGLYAHDEIASELISTNEFGVLHPDIQSFVSYHLGMYNLIHGFKKWADAEFEKIKPNTYWGQQKQYLIALGEVARDRTDSAYNKLKAQYESPTTHERIKQKVIIQLARILFEKKEFNKAFEFYKEAKPPLREEGRLLLEKAWTLFYLKDFSKALGLLETLEIPYYRASIDPEIHVLRMLIYKQLCHYNAVKNEVKKFHKNFDSAIRDIKLRRPLDENPLIASHSLLPYKEQERANFIHLLRTEQGILKTFDWQEYPFYINLVKDYKNKEKQIIRELQEKIENNAKNSAKHFLEIKEEIEFLNYSTNLDQLRIIKKGENRSYKSERISPITFDRIFWPIKTEYWKDEFPDYKVLINSRCHNDKNNKDSKENPITNAKGFK